MSMDLAEIVVFLLAALPNTECEGKVLISDSGGKVTQQSAFQCLELWIM